MKSRVWVFSELYHPEYTSTGHYVTRIAERLAQDFDVRAVCGQPNYSRRGTRAPRRERRNGVSIHRVASTRFRKDYLLLRVVNAGTLALSNLLYALRNVRMGERILVVTTPPVLPPVVAVAAALRRARFVVLIHDLYPDVLFGVGITRPDSLTGRMLDRLAVAIYRRADRLIVLGRDVRALLSVKLGDRCPPIEVITNWADLDDVRPERRDRNGLLRELGISRRFVVQYSGNLGRTHGVDLLVDVAESLLDSSDIHFLVAGWGAKQSWLRREIERRRLGNVSVVPPAPRSRLSELLGACDLATVVMAPGFEGISVPSRFYNIMAAGKPVLAAVAAGSEIARTVRENRIGWVVEPGRPADFRAAILEARSDADRLARMGDRAREVAQSYAFEPIGSRYADLFRSSLSDDEVGHRPARPDRRSTAVDSEHILT